MRPLCTLESIVDVDGLPLNGRVKVFVYGESTLAVLKDYDGNEIENPMPIVDGATEKQVFLPDEDVTIEIQVLVDPAYPSDDESWECIRSVVDNYRTVSITNDSKGLYVLATKDAIRATTPAQVQTVAGMKYVTLFSSAADTSVNYRWVSGCTIADNDGDVIASSGDSSGMWVAAFESDFVDCRIFGIVPKGSAELLTEADSVRVAGFLARCSAIGKRPYFPATSTASYYNIANNSVSDPLVDEGTIFANLSGNVANVTDSSVRLYSGDNFGKITLTADTVKTSQNMKRSTNIVLVARVTAILDTNYFGNYTWDGINVVVDVDQDGGTFTHCTFVGTGVISEGTFDGCQIHESMLTDDFDFSLSSFTNCSTDISSWDDFDRYLTFCVANGETEVDLHGNTITAFPASASNGVLVRNAVVDYSGTIPNVYSFNNTTFEKTVRSTFFNCENCIFSTNATCMTDEDENTSGTVSAKFNKCSFLNNHNVVMDFGTSERASLAIMDFVIKDCIFTDVSPVSATYSGEDTDSANQNAIKELEITRLHVIGCIGAKWSTDTFVVTKSITPDTTIEPVLGTALLADIGFPFTKCTSVWEMQTSLYLDVVDAVVATVYGREISPWASYDATASDYVHHDTRLWVGRYEYLASGSTRVNGATVDYPPTQVIAYAKIRRIA